MNWASLPGIDMKKGVVFNPSVILSLCPFNPCVHLWNFPGKACSMVNFSLLHSHFFSEIFLLRIFTVFFLFLQPSLLSSFSQSFHCFSDITFFVLVKTVTGGTLPQWFCAFLSLLPFFQYSYLISWNLFFTWWTHHKVILWNWFLIVETNLPLSSDSLLIVVSLVYRMSTRLWIFQSFGKLSACC